MGDPYTPITRTPFNPSPPADDGTEVEANKVKYETILDKIGTPLSTDIDQLNTAIDGAFDTQASLYTTTSAKTTTYIVLTSDNGTLFLGDASGGAFTFTLPTAASAADGFRIGFKKTDSSVNALTIDGNGSETIDGATTITVDNQFDEVLLVTDGTTWHIAGKKGFEGPVSRFLVEQANQTNFTGDNTDYTITFTGTEIVDNGADFASSTFTAPITGTYFIGGAIRLTGFLTAHTEARTQIVSSNRTYLNNNVVGVDFAITGGTTFHARWLSLVDMDAADTITITTKVDSGTKVVDNGGGGVGSGDWIYGWRVS